MIVPLSSPSSETDLSADVVILGGGLVGGTLAAALASHGVSVVLVDHEAADVQHRPDYDGRCSAIAAGCASVLEEAGVWRRMRTQAQPISHIQISDGDSPLQLHYDSETMAEPMGWVVENRAVRLALNARFAELDRLKPLFSLSAVRIDRTPFQVAVTLNDGRFVKAALVVGADGRRSQVRACANIDVYAVSYRQSAIVLTIGHEKPHRGVAYERFRPAGPFAVLPLVGGHRSSLVWTEETQAAQTIVALPDPLFQTVLENRCGAFLGAIHPVGSRFCYPLSLQAANRFIDLRLALVGDAAHGMHPVAGQGMNYGLRDVAALTEKIVEAKRLGLDLGAESVLKAYQRRRLPDTLLMLGATDGLVRLFSNAFGPVQTARRLGLAAVDHLPPLKRFFMRQAMGRSPALPKMMHGRTV